MTGSANGNVGSATADACVACAPGSWQAAAGAASCTQCPAGKFGLATGSATDPCQVCTDPHRDRGLVCVVESVGA